MLRLFFYLSFTLSLFLFCIEKTEADNEALQALIKGQNEEVSTMIRRIVYCIHFAGEEPYDEERAEFIEKAFEKYRCTSVDKDSAELLERYGHREDIKAIIEEAYDW